jgi:hypothetical protein
MNKSIEKTIRACVMFTARTFTNQSQPPLSQCNTTDKAKGNAVLPPGASVLIWEVKGKEMLWRKRMNVK